MPRQRANAEPMPSEPRSRRGSPRLPGWLFGLLCGAALTLATGPALLLAALLSPGLVALLVDRAPGKPAARAMLLFGGCGCIGPLRETWGWGHGSHGTAMLDQALGADALATAWLAALAGWLVHQLAPVLIGSIMQSSESRRIARLMAARARHEEEWAAPAK